MSEKEHFKLFAESLEQIILGYGTTEEDFTSRQKRQVENLVQLEKEFREALIRDENGPAAYKAFMNYILNVRSNILAARPFFRERQDDFTREISPALKNKNDKALYKYNINYPFIALVTKAVKFSPKSKVAKLAKKVAEQREEIIEMNMPLAISRARIFQRMTPKSHLEYMDLVQISSEGLISAVDKFVLPYTPVFRAVIIGRITGNLIDDYSETMLHFYPKERRKLYKAHKVRGRMDKDATPEDISHKVNIDSDTAYQTTPSEIFQLVSAASHVSIFAPAPESGNVQEGEIENPIDKYEAGEMARPDTQFEKAERWDSVKQASKSLTTFERKLLMMKGIEL